MGQHTGVNERTGGCQLASEKLCKLSQQCQLRFVFDAASAADDNLRLIDGSAGNDLFLDGEYLICLVAFDRDLLGDDLAAAAVIRLQRGEYLLTDGRHLRPLLKNNYVSENVPAVCGRGLVENAVLVIAKVDSVRSQTGVQVVHEPGCEVTAKFRCSVEQDRGLVLLCKLAESLLVGSCRILGKCLVLR